MSTQYFRFNSISAAAPRRAPLLERVLARADESRCSGDWRADAFRVLAPHEQCMPAVAAAALCAEFGALQAAWVAVATPVHYLAEMSNVRLAQDGILSMRPAEAVALAADFNRVWQDSGIGLIAAPSGQLFCTIDHALQVSGRDPEDVLGRHIEEYLPSGADAPPLRRLMSEIEMWLFEHALNGVRIEQGLLAISGLWLWGGGPALHSLPAVQGFCAGDDVFFNAFSGQTSDVGVIKVSEVPGSDAWQQIESRRLKNALSLLRSGRISRLTLSAADRCFTLSARGSRRFWRRPRPWWEQLL